jgi:hypothetical protein
MHLHSLNASSLAGAALLSTLAACGGGGDSGATPAPSSNTTFAVATAYHQVLTTAHSWTVTGQGSDGNTYQIVYALQPGANGTFALTGTAGATQVQTGTITVPGFAPTTTSGTNYFNATTDASIGFASTSDSGCSRTDSATSLPATAHIGDSGNLETTTDFLTCTVGASVDSTTTTTWSLEVDGNVALFCTNESTLDVGASAPLRANTCFEIGSDGSVLGRARLVINDPTGPFTLTARNY